MKITGYHIEDGVLANSNGEFETQPELFINFLMKEEEQSIGICWHLDYFVAKLLKSLDVPIEAASKLWMSRKLRDTHTNHDFQYYPTRNFSIKFGKSFYGSKLISFSNASQYLKEEIEDVSNETRSPSYVIKKANEAKNAGERAYQALQSLGLHPKSLTSPINAFQKERLANMGLPTVSDLEDEVAIWAYECCHGGWLECFHKGYFKEAYDWDINCYSHDTECLSEDGWKLIKDLAIGEKILAFDAQKEICQFEEVQRLYSEEYKGPMINIKSKRWLDILVTPNHRILYKDWIRRKESAKYKYTGEYGTTNWRVKLANHIPDGNIILPISYPIEDRPEYPISNDWLRLTAWINTEGNKTGKAIEITQSIDVNPQNCKEIESVITNLEFSHTSIKQYTAKNGKTCNTYYISVKDTQERIIKLLDNKDIHLIPKWILLNCSIRQLKIYFETLIKGDGSINSISEGYEFYTKLNENADRMMQLCHLLGLKCKKATNIQTGKYPKPRYTIRINIHKKNRHSTYILNGKENIKVKQYLGKVYCPTVNSGFIVVRRNGKSSICGNSAYAHHCSRLPDFRLGMWVKTNTMPKNARIGFLKGEITIESEFSPIIYNVSEQSSYTPIGSWHGTFTLDEINFVEKHKLGSFIIDEGWFWIPTQELSFPLLGLMNTLYDKKEQTSTSLDKECIKRIMTGTWGKMIETYEGGNKTGPLFNSVWGCLGESRPRLQVAEFCLNAMQQGARILSIAVDGVITDQNLDLKKNNPNLIGQWRLSTAGPVIVISSGVIGMSNTKAEAADFSISYGKLKGMLEAEPDTENYIQYKNGFVTLGTALLQNRYDDLGKRETIERTIKISADPKRYCENGPTVGKDILFGQYSTEPWDIHFILGSKEKT